ncbi:MAG: alanine dehydrogenase [Flavobacteriaceae bacterium]|jgi:alanine dehydrogenase|nr:alanine dehydrogenase [Flavobacteriaceae bacterium]MBT6448863.1 alanine dehydrogenase [Flavobacteriaceae bacterium]MBT7624076.1 alanine dehydrogenase [Flavobacteriaceae bacterium]
MTIGIPKEIKDNEFRVGMTPSGVNSFVRNGHTVYVEKGAGLGSGFSDGLYSSIGAEICNSVEEVYSKSEMIIKVKEPLKQEYSLIKKDQIIYTFFHFASSKGLTEAMIKSGAICIAYETVQNDDYTLPLLTPMSEVAGRMATQQGAKFLEKPQSGHGILLGGVPGVKPANVIVLGGGVVGTQAAKMAAGLGANVTIFDISLDRLRKLDDIMPKNVNTQFSNTYNILEAIKNAHLIIGAVLIPGAKAPNLITKKMLKHLNKGTVLVDVAVDQGGCFETTHPTTHKDPTYIIDDVLHYSVANMPGAVPVTSTEALTNATISRGLSIANKGWKNACNDDMSLRLGLNIINGKIVYKAVADAFNFDYIDLNEII